MSLHKTIRDTLCTATKDLRSIALFPEEVLNGLSWKKANDPVTAHDKATEQVFRKALAPYNLAIVGEEYGGRASGLTAHIDPIDSTKSFISGRHGAGVAIGIADGNTLLAGGVGDIRSGLVYFTDGTNAERIEVYSGRSAPLTGRSPLPKPLIIANGEAANDALKLENRGYAVSVGSGFALNIAMVAAGSYDAFIAYGRPNGDGPNTWDLAGGLVLCKTAGVAVRHLDGRDFSLHDRFTEGMVVAWPDKLEALEDALREYRASSA